MFNFKFMPSDGSDIGALVAQIICENPQRASRAAQKSADAMIKIVRRSLGKTGSVLFRIMKKGFREGNTSNPWGLEPRQRYTNFGFPWLATGSPISTHIRDNPPYSLKKGVYPEPTKRNPPVGEKFSGLMQYFMNDKNERDISTLEIGLIPSRRGGQKWADAFSDWQEAGPIKVDQYYKYSRRNMIGYFDRIGMPLAAGTILKRPARPVIEKVQEMNDPVELFKKHFIDRLSRGLR